MIGRKNCTGQILLRNKWVKIKSLRRTLIQYDWCPYKKRKIWTQTMIEKRLCEGTGRRQTFTGQRKKKTKENKNASPAVGF